MRKFNNGSIPAVATFLLLICLAWAACRKTDTRPDKPLPANANHQFFNTHPSGLPELAVITAFLQRQDQQFDFTPAAVQYYGVPYWDKAILYRLPDATGRENQEENAFVAYIPVVRDSLDYVNAQLVIKVTPSDTLYRFYTAGEYASFGFAPNADTSLNAIKLFSLFACHEKNVFGHTRFRILDNRILAGQTELDLDTTRRYLLELSEQVSTGRLVAAALPHSSCMLVNDYIAAGYQVEYYHVGPVCVITALGGGGLPGSGGGGSSSGGGSWNNPSPSCNSGPVSRVYAGQPCGGGSPGWQPVPPAPPPSVNPAENCDSTDKYSGATATAQYISLKSTVEQFTAFDPAVTDQAEQYFLVEEVNGAYQPGTIQTLPTTGGSMQGVTASTVMVVHTHPYGGYQSPSPADFFGLANFESNFLMNYVIAYDGTKYAMVVNNFSQLQTFMAANQNSFLPTGEFDLTSNFGKKWAIVFATLVDQGYTEDEAYERALAYLIKIYAGVTLVKAKVNSDSFKKIGLKIKTDNGVPVLNSYGHPLFEKADCP